MKEKILVIFGSMSSEHEISCISAGNIISNLNKEKYEITMLGIDKNGKWYYYLGTVENVLQNKWIDDENNKVEILDIMEELKKYDVIFPVLHGKYGEDGAIQGLLEMAHSNYVGCKVLGSSIGMDKILSKELVSSIGIDVVDYIAINNNFNITEILNEVEEKLKYPVIVKPSKEGSSYGVTKVDKKEDLLNAIEFALKYDKEILIEKYIDNRKEIECAVIEINEKNKIYASTPGEIVSANEFYDFNAKYENNKSYTQIPANLSGELIEKIKEHSIKIFKKLRINSLARIDFFVSNEKIYFNEVNTMPGFTSISMYPMMLMHDEISYSKILDILIENSKM